MAASDGSYRTSFCSEPNPSRPPEQFYGNGVARLMQSSAVGGCLVWRVPVMEVYGGLILFVWIIGGSCVVAAIVSAQASKTSTL
jgi:hypothetical protein